MNEYTYIAWCPCDCGLVGLATDRAQHGRMIGKWITDGLRVERVSSSSISGNYKLCRCGGKQESPEQNKQMVLLREDER
jgi:hypothetical protein